jgi:GDP-4-dehydro-6-deoxy-D-mannose reductase
VKALVTGAGGFVGGHLVRYLQAQDDVEVVGSVFRDPTTYDDLSEGVRFVQADLREPDTLRQIMNDVRPDHIYHLAGQAFVPLSFDDPWPTLHTNIRAQLNVLEAARYADWPCRVLVLGSGDVYGPITPEQNPVDEKQPFNPTSPYSVSKITQDLLGQQYHYSFDVDCVIVRPFNHFGPRQNKRFVAPAFASQVAAIERGEQEPVVRVGNLEAERDFTDVRDIVRAYCLLMAHGTAGEVYNVGSGQAHSIRYLLDVLLSYSDVSIDVTIDPDRLRPVEVPLVVCDATRLRQATGWEPQYSFEETLRDVLAEWRGRQE